MTVHQVPAETGVFARYLKGLTALLDPHGGWYAVFLQRDPEGMRACLDGHEVPPWDVVGSLLQDLTVARGPEFADPEQARAQQLHAASAAAYDRRPGGREALEQRLGLMRGELVNATARSEELIRRLASEPQGTETGEQLANELEWARDDHGRATARVAELLSRLASLPGPEHARPDQRHAWARPTANAPGGRGHAAGGAPAEHAEPRQPARKAKRKRPGGARFAGLEDVEEAAAVPLLPVGADLPRGARFGGGDDSAQEGPAQDTPAPEAVRAARETVHTLGRLRAEGRSGEAHAVLCEAAALPADWLPLIASELHRAGLEADWATLLWEAASQPVLRLTAVAGALSGAGHEHDGHQLLRQGVARPADEIADAVLALDDEGRPSEAQALLTAFAQLHTAADTAHIADRDPRRLVPRLLAVARARSRAHERDLVHALRVAGHLGG